MSEPLNLDPAAIQRLLRLGDSAFACKMMDLFLEYAGQKITDARAAYSSGNLAALEKAVHPIKSSAGNVGARRVQELAMEIEDLARQGQSESLAAAISRLEEAFCAVKPELAEKRKSLSEESSSSVRPQ